MTLEVISFVWTKELQLFWNQSLIFGKNGDLFRSKLIDFAEVHIKICYLTIKSRLEKDSLTIMTANLFLDVENNRSMIHIIMRKEIYECILNHAMGLMGDRTYLVFIVFVPFSFPWHSLEIDHNRLYLHRK